MALGEGGGEEIWTGKTKRKKMGSGGEEEKMAGVTDMKGNQDVP